MYVYINNNKSKTTIKLKVVLEDNTKPPKDFNNLNNENHTVDKTPFYEIKHSAVYYYNQKILVDDTGAHCLTDGSILKPTRCSNPKCRTLIGFIQHGFIRCPKCGKRFLI